MLACIPVTINFSFFPFSSPLSVPQGYQRSNHFIATQGECTVTHPAAALHSWRYESEFAELMMCKQRGACVASRSHLDFRHKRARRRGDCNCQSSRTVNCWVSLRVKLCSRLSSSSSSPPSACVARHLSDVVLIRYISCISQAARTLTRRDGMKGGEAPREKESATFSLFSADSDPVYSVNVFFTLQSPSDFLPSFTLVSVLPLLKSNLRNFLFCSLTFRSSRTRGRWRECRCDPPVEFTSGSIMV